MTTEQKKEYQEFLDQKKQQRVESGFVVTDEQCYLLHAYKFLSLTPLGRSLSFVKERKQRRLKKGEGVRPSPSHCDNKVLS